MSAIVDNEIFGWNLLYEMNKDFIKSKFDIMVAVVHWALISKGFRCVGLGDDHNITPNLELSECLPSGWSKMGFYKIRYIYNFELYILASAKDMAFFCLNLMQPFDLGLTIINLEYNIIHGIKGTLDEIMPDYTNVLSKIHSTLIYPFVKNYLTRDEATQASDLEIALDNTPPELEPIVRVFKTTHMERTMSMSNLNEIIMKFEEALSYIRNPQLYLENDTTINDWITYHTDDDDDNYNNGSGPQQGGGNFNVHDTSEYEPENQGGNNGLDPGDAGGDTQVDDGNNEANEMNDCAEEYKNLTSTDFKDFKDFIDEVFDTFSTNIEKKLIDTPSKQDNIIKLSGEETIETESVPSTPDHENISSTYEEEMQSKYENETGDDLTKRRQELLKKLDPIDLHLMENINIWKKDVCRHSHQVLKRGSKFLQSKTIDTKIDAGKSSNVCVCCIEKKIYNESDNETSTDLTAKIDQYLATLPITSENQRLKYLQEIENIDFELEGAVGGFSLSALKNFEEENEDLVEADEIEYGFCIKCLME